MSGFIKYYEFIFTMLGLNTNTKRFLFGSTIGFVTQMIAKPSISYDERGYARPFALTTKSNNSTYIPWWSWPIAFGTILMLFI